LLDWKQFCLNFQQFGDGVDTACVGAYAQVYSSMYIMDLTSCPLYCVPGTCNITYCTSREVESRELY
jgi:hypothetical protein